MTDIPKLALQRLHQEQGNPAGVHPDTDLLTAFAEQALKGRERDLVLAHLAQCADCREIALLAGAEVSQDQLAQIVPARARKGFWAWGPLRWTAAAATAAVVLSAVWLNVHESGRQQVASYSEKTPAIVQRQQEAAHPSQPATAEPGRSVSEAHPQNEKVEPQRAIESLRDSYPDGLNAPMKQKKGMTVAPPPASKDLGQFAGGAVGGQSAVLDEQKTARADQKLSDRNEVSTNGNMAAVPSAGASPAPPTSAPAAAPQVTMTYSRKAAGELAPATNMATGKADAAKTSARVLQRAPRSADQLSEAATAAAPAENYQLKAELAKASVQGPAWRVTGDGQLQRSEDGGQKWIAMLAEIGSFHAVASSGPIVWAGADNGALWSSSNAGQTWRKMVPSFEGRSPRGNVLSIEAPSSQVVSFRTSSGETWSSGDAGATWTAK